MSTMTIINGNNNDKDNVRAIMVKGETGATITSITKTGTNVLTDTYTITLSDGRTQTFEVTNGKGITSIAKTGTQGLVDTYTITFNDNTTQTFTVTNGQNGTDGYSPTATVTKTNSVATISITDKNGTTTATVNDGAPGYEVPANSVIGWDSNDVIPAGYEDTGNSMPSITDSYSTSTEDGYSCNYVNGLNTYSTTERRIGTWIDGKPIYRKVVDCGALPNAQGKNVAHGISNLKRIINAYGYSYNSQIGVTYPLPCVNSEGVGYQVALRFQGNNIVLTSGSTDRTDFAETYVIIEYTKTTD